jgi:hypothetical protein
MDQSHLAKDMIASFVALASLILHAKVLTSHVGLWNKVWVF